MLDTTSCRIQAKGRSDGTIYSPLPERGFIRLLKLHPGHDSSLVECEVEIVSIDESANHYEAISYVWGDPNVREAIRCNNTDIQITTNLANALRMFRHPTNQRLLWADAICINQENIKERTAQVQQMDKVFTNAKQVLVWLGCDPDDEAKGAFSLITTSNNFFLQQQTNNGVTVMPWQMNAPVEPHPIRVDDEGWPKVLALLSSTWFERMWVVQEVGLARECHAWWGTHSISISQLFEFAVWCVRDDFLPASYYFDIKARSRVMFHTFQNVHIHYASDQFRRSWKDASRVLTAFGKSLLNQTSEDYHQPRGLSGVLAAGSSFQASDPRDHIFAFAGIPLAKDTNGQPLIKVDYDSTPAEVFCQVACALLRQKQTAPRFLSYVQHHQMDDTSKIDIPSWVPLWDRFHCCHNYGCPDYWYKAGGGGERFSVNIDSNRVLNVEGFVFDHVVWVSDIISARNFWLDRTLWDEDVRAAGRLFIDILWESIPKIAAVSESCFYRTLLGDFPRSPRRQHNAMLVDSMMRNYRTMVQSFSASSKLPTRNEIMSPEQVASTLMRCNKRRLMVTKTGRFGLVPGYATNVGDACCIIIGTSTPFILNPLGDGTHRLVGHCFIDGVMDGCMAAQVQSGERQIETLVIR